MWLHPVSIKENVQTYISPKLCIMPEIKSKYYRTGECVGIGQTTVYGDDSILNIGPNIQAYTVYPDHTATSNPGLRNFLFYFFN